MECSFLGLVLDSSILIAAERRRFTPHQSIETVQKMVGEVPIVLSSITIAEIGHGIYRANTPEIRERRRAFLDELKATVPIHPSQKIRRRSSPGSAASRLQKESICHWAI